MGVVMGQKVVGPKSGPAKTGPAVPLATPMPSELNLEEHYMILLPYADPTTSRMVAELGKNVNVRSSLGKRIAISVQGNVLCKL